MLPSEAQLETPSDDVRWGIPSPLPTGPPPAPKTGFPWARLAVPLATLVLVGISLALFIEILAMPPGTRDAFLMRNALGASVRKGILPSLAWGALLPMIGAVAVLVLRRRADPAASLERASRLVAPLIVLALVPSLFNLTLGHQATLTYLILLGVFVLLCEPLLRTSIATALTMESPVQFFQGFRSLFSPRFARWFFFSVVVLAAAGYAAYVGYFTIMNHRRLGTTAFDLGIYDNLIFNAMHGHPFRATVLFGPAGGNNLASHAEFAVLLFVPFYAIRPGAETMLIIQAVTLGFAAVPLYLFASTALPRATAAVVAVAYLLFAPLHGPNFYDFHWLPLAIFFHFWLYYGIAIRKNWLIGVMLVILFAIREDIAVGLAVLGLFLLVTGLRPRLGLLLAVVSAAWFGIDRFIIMPLAGAWYFQNFYVALFADGVATFGSVFKTILTNPLYFLTTFAQESKLIYALHMFVPLAFLPLRRLALALLALPGVFFTIMTTGYAPTVAISFQYTTHWIPYLFLATVLALIVIGRTAAAAQSEQAWRGVTDAGHATFGGAVGEGPLAANDLGAAARRAALVTMLVVMLGHSYNFGAILQRQNFVGGFGKIEFKMTPAEKQRYKELKELIAMIPPTASVAATEQETPHISARKTAYPLRTAPGPVDYILVGRSHIGDLSRAALNAGLADPKAYGLLAERGDELFLFKRGHTSPQTLAARAKLGIP